MHAYASARALALTHARAAPLPNPRPAGLCPLAPGASDIGQLALLQRLLGQITPRSWPGVEKLPDWGKVRFDPPEGGDPGSGGADPAEFARAGLAGALQDAGSDALDLLASLLR